MVLRKFTPAEDLPCYVHCSVFTFIPDYYGSLAKLCECQELAHISLERGEGGYLVRAKMHAGSCTHVKGGLSNKLKKQNLI